MHNKQYQATQEQ